MIRGIDRRTARQLQRDYGVRYSMALLAVTRAPRPVIEAGMSAGLSYRHALQRAAAGVLRSMLAGGE